MSAPTSLMQFPCNFILKIIGVNKPTFADEIKKIVHQFYPLTEDKNFSSKMSEQNAYIAINVVIHALDQPTLDALYQQLVNHPDVKMVL